MSHKSHSYCNTPWAEHLPLFFEEMAPPATSSIFSGIGLGIMSSDYSDYFDTLDTNQSEFLPSTSLVQPDSTPATRPFWSGEYTQLGDFSVFDSPECAEVEAPGWTGEYSSLDSLPPPPLSNIDPRYLAENGSLTSLFSSAKEWEKQLINSHAAGEDGEEECNFDYYASSYSTVFDGSIPPPATAQSYYELEYQNTDSTSSQVTNFSVEYFSRCGLQVESVTSGTVSHTGHVAEVAQVAEVAHSNELTPRVSGGSVTLGCLKVAKPRRLGQMLKRIGRNRMSLRVKQKQET
ncbi:hypothetical protein ACLX1H_003402 [Fusarium chlamydosporum]